jgi:hypothetical protein
MSGHNGKISFFLSIYYIYLHYQFYFNILKDVTVAVNPLMDMNAEMQHQDKYICMKQWNKTKWGFALPLGF